MDLEVEREQLKQKIDHYYDILIDHYYDTTGKYMFRKS